MKPPWTLSVATYNVLAEAYVKPEHYPLVAPEDFLPANRHPKLDARVATFDTDVICLQEVEYAAFRRFDDLLRPKRYRGRWAHRSGGKPDGCATFVRAPWRMRQSTVLEFDDGAAVHSRRIALSSVIVQPGILLEVVNVHFEWQEADAKPDQAYTEWQARQLLATVRGLDRIIVCGDFNAAPDSAVLAAFREAEFLDAHAAGLATFNNAGRPAKLDHLLHTSDLAATPSPTTFVGPRTPLPSPIEPSDHVPLIATFAPKPR